MSLITFTSDFSQKDEWVAIVKGVIKNIAPEAQILDITHEVPLFNIQKGALVLNRAVKYIKADIHLAVVDPEVGKNRKAIIIKTLRGDILVGPDNGLLELSAKELGIKKVIVITNRKYFLKPVSATFHARDIFAPVCAYLATGKPVESFGREMNPLLLKRLDIKKPVKKGHELILEVIENDKYGTARLNVDFEKIKKYQLKINRKYSLQINDKTHCMKFVNAFNDLEPLEAGLIVDSSNQLCVFLNKGSASDILGLKPGKEVHVTVKSQKSKENRPLNH